MIVITPFQSDLYFAIGKGVITIIILVFIFLLVRYIIKRVLPGVMAQVGARVDIVVEGEKNIVAEVKEMADERPDDLAALIKVWVKEEE
jgi:flagellar biosynthesis/type III secretory pathway M-ring protein FliF/YscJ